MLSLRFQVAGYNIQLFVTKSLQSLVTALHNMKIQRKQKKILDKTNKPATFCWGFVAVLSELPNKGPRWDNETCSINDVPYFRKYHHSNIYISATSKQSIGRSNYKFSRYIHQTLQNMAILRILALICYKDVLTKKSHSKKIILS